MRCVLLFVLFGIFAAPAFAATNDAAALWEKSCSQCHGHKGDGRGRGAGGMTPAPTDFTQPGLSAKLSRDAIIKSIAQGKSGTAMVGYGRLYSADQIAGLADYIRASFMAGAVPPVVSGDAGRALYTQHCAVCHGDDGKSGVWARGSLNPPPRNFTTAQAHEELSLERMITSVTHGRPGTAMMSFQGRLNDEQIKQVVGFVRREFMRVDDNNQALATPPGLPPSHPKIDAAAASAPHPITKADMSAPMPNGLRGDVAWGREFFMNNCFTCHGKQGKGDGPRAYFNRPAPRNFTSEESRLILNRPRLFKSIHDGRIGSVMPAWGKVLDDQQIANVAEFVFQTFVQAKPAAQSVSPEKKSPTP